MGNDYVQIGEDRFRVKISPYLTREYEVRRVGKFKNIQEMFRILPSLMDEFAKQGYVKMERESGENVVGTDHHWGLFSPTRFSHSLTLKLEKIRPSIKESGFAKEGVFDKKTIFIHDNGIISINSEFWENPQLSLFPL
ncbi:MAG: hypothetical protein Q8P15_01600 [Nanoarchaeota archaeon]|nr:hypothetical protein [Nanoarchaeota archaeon]